MFEVVKNSSRKKIPVNVQCMLWARAAGRCEFEGCNRPLWKSLVTQEQVNAAQKAHIYAYSEGGARGNRGVPKSVLNSVDNLMLVCPVCHLKIDQHKDGGRYSASLLQGWKRMHEQRVERVTAIAPSKQSHVVHYSANIDVTSVNLCFEKTAASLFPARYPAEDTAIELGRRGIVLSDRDAAFWSEEAEHLKRSISRRIIERVTAKEIEHLSLFALAPQPLLVLLGSLLPEVVPADVYGHHKEQKGWTWQERSRSVEFEVIEPERKSGPPALVFSLSADVIDQRIQAVLGKDASIWQVRIPKPHSDFLKTRQQLQAFRQCVRPLLDHIKSAHKQDSPLHVFPAMPAAAAVELGRLRAPKAAMTWNLYDQVNARGGFVPALALEGATHD